MNSRWSRALLIGLLGVLAPACHGEKEGASPEATQRDATLLARELVDIMDRVMSYRSAHMDHLPTSLRQAGLDSLAPDFVRRLGRQGEEPLVTIAFRRPQDHQVASCSGTSVVLEDAVLHDGEFDLTCTLPDGRSQTFRIRAPQPRH